MPEGLEQMPDADFRNLIWYILAPPQDGKPLTPERRRELIGGAETGSWSPPAGDGESVALWAPGWEVASAETAGAPAKIPEFKGRLNVLSTHPFDDRHPASIARPLTPPLGQNSSVSVAVAADSGASWELRVLADGEVIRREFVVPGASPWKDVRVDLTPFAGRRIVLRLENAAAGPQDARAYWTSLQLENTALASR
jgi:hypothetical protein